MRLFKITSLFEHAIKYFNIQFSKKLSYELP